MPRRRNSINNTVQPTSSLRRSPRFTTPTEKLEPVRLFTIRRSPRFFRKNDDPSSSDGQRSDPFQEKGAKKKASRCSNSSRKFPRSDNRTEEFQNLRRSPRLSIGPKVESDAELSKKSTNVVSCNRRRSSRFRQKSMLDEGKEKRSSVCEDEGKEDLLDVREEAKSIVLNSSEKSMEKNERTRQSKRNRQEEKVEERKIGAGQQEWTEEQEAALQIAYLAAKPTPHFWKKVSKMVPGKSAQECFDKVHSDQSTPPQPQPRSRAKKPTFSSSSPSSSLSPLQFHSLFGNTKLKSRNKKQPHLAPKVVRHLLQKNSQLARDYSHDDLFLLLEYKNIDNPSTPMHFSDKKQGLLLKCDKTRSRSGGSKKSISRFGQLATDANLVSPPVLKPVKNMVLHERYIDQLHCREARRKAASGRKIRSAIDLKEGVKGDMVRSAKNALISDAREAIDKFQILQHNVLDYSMSGLDDDDGVDGDDLENDEETG